MPARRTILLLLTVALLISGCGKKGPMLYPDMLIAQPPQQISLEQSGSVMRLSFDLPTKDLAGRKLEDLEAFQIARRVYRSNECVSCQDQYQELLKIDLEVPAPAQRQGNRISWIDSDVRTGERYQYRIKTVQKDGVVGSVAATMLVSLQSPPAAPVVKARAVFGGLIVLELEGRPAQDSSLVGYRLYRADGTVSIQMISSLAAGTSRYEDQAVQKGIVYRYGAKMVVKRGDGVIAESELSEQVSISVVDDPK